MGKPRRNAKPIEGVLVKDKHYGAANRPPRRVFLTPKETVAVKALVSGMTKAQAAVVAGYKSPQTLYNKFSQTNGTGKTFRVALHRSMSAMGLTPRALLKPIKDATTAGMVKWNSRSEQWDKFADHRTRLEASKLGLDLLGAFPRAEDRGPLVAVQINTNLQDPESRDEAFSARALMEGEPPEAVDITD